MRLIDADKCPCIVCEETRNAHCTYEHRSCNRFCEWISREAYDIDKVVKELDKLDVKAIKRYKGGTFGDYEGTDYYIKKSEAIEIVKAGVKNE